jgi:hypothetical protein
LGSVELALRMPCRDDPRSGVVRPDSLGALALGWGRKLARREPVAASELAGRPGCDRLSSTVKLDLDVFSEDRRADDERADIEACALSLGLDEDCGSMMAGDASRSRKDRRECPVLEGVSSLGDSDMARPNGPRMLGSFELFGEGVIDDADRWLAGVRRAYGLGVVRFSGLKLWPVSTSTVLDETFQRGRLSMADGGRWDLFEAMGLVTDELAMDDSLDDVWRLLSCDMGAGSKDCRRLALARPL